MMRVLTAVLLAVLAACAAGPSRETYDQLDQITATQEPRVTSRGVFVVVYERDPEARRTESLPLGIAAGFSCNLGVTRLGEAMYAPDRIARLENALADAFPDRAPGSTLVVRRYDVYFNRGAEASTQTTGVAVMGPLGAGARPNYDSGRQWREPRCSRERMAGGWFDPADLTNNYAPITIDLDVTVFERAHVINVALSPEVDLTTPGGTLAREAIVQRAMYRLQDRLVAAINAAQ